LPSGEVRAPFTAVTAAAFTMSSGSNQQEQEQDSLMLTSSSGLVAHLRLTREVGRAGAAASTTALDTSLGQLWQGTCSLGAGTFGGNLAHLALSPSASSSSPTPTLHFDLAAAAEEMEV
jgi:hypothetical protein